jgi:hypothetical protein
MKITTEAGAAIGAPLKFYSRDEASWPPAWRLPEQDDDDADLYDKVAHLTDDAILRTAVNVWDNCMRAPGAFEAVVGGMISAHARLVVGSGGCTDLEQAAEAFGKAWLGMAKQAALLGFEGEA